MDFNKIVDLLTKSNINTEAIYDLISVASKMDLSDENNQRILIQKGGLVAGKSISKEQEDNIINVLKEKGISEELFSLIK